MSYQFQSYNGSERYRGSWETGVSSSFFWNPWGDGQTTTAGVDEDQYHYAGLDTDPDGTQQAQFRNYNPNTAQWMSPDPYDGSYRPGNPQSLNRYAYALNNPLMFIDPTGLEESQTPVGWYVDQYGNYYYWDGSELFGGGSIVNALVGDCGPGCTVYSGISNYTGLIPQRWPRSLTAPVQRWRL